MASNRHLGRIIALQSIYEYDFRLGSNDNVQISEVLDRNIARYKEMVEDMTFVKNLVTGCSQSLTELDELIQPLAPEWPLAQISRIDHAILRLSLYELLSMSQDIPAKVTINEAVELAKSFGSDNSSKFINGVLGTAYRKFEADEISASFAKPLGKDTKPTKPKTSAKSTTKRKKAVNEKT